ncbi:CaiB/BaiF CoA transferase family protein [Williamsia sp. MIQD14]|uniref:CaiB/BaiF CoA transferase family protein n=1 Tax=Williamsia sp. MIQD14 TaxID=3425703 RepID=UPI003DA06AFE
MMTGALDGIVVADFSRVLAGPYATMMMGDLGAEVVKVERPGTGDDTRSWGPPYLPADENTDPMATYFASVNRNKTSLVVDLQTEDGREQARDLVRRSDVVIENFRAGTMERLGLGYDTLVAEKPDLIYCAITGFGRDDGADIPGYDLLIQAMSGLMSITGPDGSPSKVGVAVVDVLTGVHAVAGILAALRHRDRTGEGQRVDLNLFMVALSSMANMTTAYLGADVVPRSMGNRHPSIVPYEVFSTADRPLALAVGNDTQFARLATALGVPDLVDDERYATNTARVAHRDDLVAELTEKLRHEGADHWYQVLTRAGVPAGPINDIAEAFTFARSIGIEPAVDVEGTDIPAVGNPIGMSLTPATYRLPPPVLPT